MSTSGRLRAAASRVAGHVSPRHRAWRQLLSSCDLDPDQLPTPLASPGPNDFIICGAPRSGTALATAALFQPPHSVTVMEPWDGLRLPPDQLFRSLREELASGQLRRGRLDIGALRSEGAVRWCRDGELTSAVEASDDTLLGVKWPSFWRYLDLLPETKFVVCVRDPAEVVASYRTKGGRIGMGLEYDVPFNARMNAELGRIDDVEQRRIALYDYVYERIIPHLEQPNVFELRYERWFNDKAGVVNQLARFLDRPLDPRTVLIRPPQHRVSDGPLRVPSRTSDRLGYT